MALPAEAKSLGAQHGYVGDYFSVDGGSVAISGIGPNRAAAAAQRFVQRGAKALVSWGTAGGLATMLRPGDVMIPDRLENGQTGDIITLDAGWCESVKADLITRLPVTSGTLYSSYRPILSLAEKRRLASHKLTAIDMESAAIATVAAHAGLPFLAIKAICDPAERAVPEALLKMLGDNGRLRLPGLLSAACGGIPVWRAATALRGDFAAASQALGTVAKALPTIAGYTRAL